MKKLNKNDILKGSFVFLITVFVILSSISIKANTVAPLTSAVIREEPEFIGTQSFVLLEEGFEDGVMPPPGGWSTVDNHPTNNWEIVDAASEPDLVHTGDYAAVVRWDHITAQDEWLISPEIDLTSGYDSASLTFWANCWTLVTGATVKVWIINDDINDVIWDMQEDEDWPENPPFYREVVLDLTPYVGESFTIEWQYVGITLAADFAMDDIVVDAELTIPPPILEIGEITGGWAGFGKGGKVSAEIKNTAAPDESDATDVEWNIYVKGNGIFQKINESGSGNISVIAPGGVEIVESPVGHHLGKVNVTVTAYEPHFDLFVSKSVNGFIFIGLVIILKGG